MSDESPVTLINVFEVPAEQVEAFTEVWLDRAKVMAAMPGFVDFRLHKAISTDSRFQVVNVAHWESEAAWQSAFSDPAFQRELQVAFQRSDLDFTANPALYRVIIAEPS